MRPAELIEQKRNGGEHDPAELAELILAYARDEVPDYQLAAWCMAVYFQGLTAAETHALTDAMIRSGETLDLGAALGRKVRRQALDRRRGGQDVHRRRADRRGVRRAAREDVGTRPRSHGWNARQARVDPGVPGRAHDRGDRSQQLREVGMAIVGQTANLVPADKKLYALRDVTATVDIVPLIASSIMSKKLAAGAQAIVLDVKVGDGAFMKTLDDARVLAEVMREIGTMAGREVTCLLTDMEQPLGRAVGNALEVHEARDTVRGDGPADFTELVLDAAARLLAYSDLGIDRRGGAPAGGGSGAGRERARPVRAVDPRPGRRSGSRRARAGARPSGRAGPARRCRDPTRCVRRRRRGARARRRAPHEGRSDRPRCRHPLLRESAATPCSRGTTSRRCTRGTDDAAERAAAAVLAAYEIGDQAPPDHGIVLDVVA